MIPEGERILAGLEANARLRFGSERLLVFLTQKRILLVHKSKVGRATLTLSSVLGSLATGVETAVKRGHGLGELADLKPDQVISLSRENFAIEYDNIVRVEAEPISRSISRITLVSKDQKIELSVSSSALDGVKPLARSLLREKVIFKTQ